MALADLTTKKPLAPASMGAASTLSSPSSSLGGMNKPSSAGGLSSFAARKPNDSDNLNSLLSSKYKSLVSGDNPAQAQGTRTALNAFAGQEKSGMAQAAAKAARMGLAPGTPGYEQIMSEARTQVLSTGSGLLSGLAQNGLDRQTADMNAAASFQSNQDNFGQRERQFDVTSGQNQQQINNQQGQFDASLGQRDKEFGVSSGQNQQQIENQANQFSANLGQRDKEFAVSSGQNQQQIDQAAKQFAEQMGLNYATLSQEDKQFLSTLGQRQTEFGVTSGQNQQQITNQQNQFDANNLLESKKIENQASQFDVTSGQNQQQIDQAASQFAAKMGLDYATLSQQEQQQLRTLAQQATQFGVTSGQNQQKIDQDASQFDANALLETKKIDSQASRDMIAQLDAIIQNPGQYTVAQVEQAKNKRASLVGAGSGGEADKSDAELAMQGLVDRLKVQYPSETEGKIRDVAKAQFGQLSDAEMNSLLAATKTDLNPAPKSTLAGKSLLELLLEQGGNNG